GSGDLKRAEVETRSFLADFPKRADAYTLAGTFALAKQDTAGARQAFARALAIDPDAIEPLEGIVNLELIARNAANAVGLVERRLARQADNSRLLFLAGRTYFEAGQLEKSVSALRKSLDSDRSNPSTYMMLGQVYMALHQTDRALDEFSE